MSDQDHSVSSSSHNDSPPSHSEPPPSPIHSPPPASSPPSTPPPSSTPSPPPKSPPPSSPPPASPPPQSQKPPASPPPSHSSPPQSPPQQSSPPPPAENPPPRSLPPSSPTSSQTLVVTPSPPPPSYSPPRSPPSNSHSSPSNSDTPSDETLTVPPPAPNSQDEAPSPIDRYVSPLIQSPPADNSSLAPPQTQTSPTLSPTSLSPPSASTSQSTNISTSTAHSTNTSTTTSANPSQSSNSTSSTHETFKTRAIVGGSVAGIVAIALFAIVFSVCRKNKRRRSDVHAAQYTPPNNFTVQSDGYYSKQQHNFVGGNRIYESQNHPIHSGAHSYLSYGTQKGGGYQAGTPDTQIGGSKIAFSYEELMEITNGFSRQNILGEGGFGCVYKGVLKDGKVVAVKQLKAGSGQGDREFRAEVEIISRVHHRHLVSFVGYCIFDDQRLLIYEFVPNNTLEHHLHGKGMAVLDWSKRMKIALGAARGLAYLHEDCHPRIIHRDIKAANILLDDAFEAQVADFGLAKLTNDTSTHVSTRVMGTFGYMAPEYASSGKLTDRSDVFSFGVMLLELVTGRKPVDPTRPLGDESLVEWARPLLSHALNTGDTCELVDTKLEKHYVESQMLLLIEAAAACVRYSAPKRPHMKQLVRALDWESENSDLSNGVKYGQSTAYDFSQCNRDISKFRIMAFGSEDSSDFNISEEFNSQEISGTNTTWKSGETSSDYTSDELETQPINPNNSERNPVRVGGTMDVQD